MTAGPWVDDNSRKVYSKQVIRHNGVIIALLPSDGSMMPLDEKEANARAIAALPELVEAAREMSEADVFEDEDRYQTALAKLRSILRRIDGESGGEE